MPNQLVYTIYKPEKNFQVLLPSWYCKCVIFRIGVIFMLICDIANFPLTEITPWYEGILVLITEIEIMRNILVTQSQNFPPQGKITMFTVILTYTS